MRPPMRSYSLIAAYCWVDLKPRSITSVGTFGGCFFENRDEGPMFPSIWESSVPEYILGCEIDVDREPLRWGSSTDSAALCEMNWENMASAAAKVGSSRFAAGVPVLDLDRLVDFPNEPVSGTARRGLDIVGLPSALKISIPKSAKLIQRHKFDIALVLLTLETTLHRVFALRPRRHKALRLAHCEE
jgi:hypothetical protein